MKRVKLRVPGKVLLAGEYAVLSGHDSLSLAVDRYLEVTITMAATGGWQLQSDLWTKPKNLLTTSSEEIAREPLLQVAAFAQKHFSLPHVHCHIQSDLDIRFGLGSSSALRLGVLLGAAALVRERADSPISSTLEAAALVYRMQREQQSFASGYDVLTQALGGLLLWKPDFENWPGSAWQRLPLDRISSHLTIMVGGRGAPTAQVGGAVLKALAQSPIQQAYFAASDQLVQSWIQFLERGDVALPELCQNLGKHRQLFATLPYFPSPVFQALETLPGFDQTWSAKTTGAGGEDALLLIGAQGDIQTAIRELALLGWYVLPIQATELGASLSYGMES